MRYWWVPGVATEDFLHCNIGGETSDWVIITELNVKGDIIDKVSGVGDTGYNRVTMAGVELECILPTCTLGPGGTRWRGQVL